MISYYILYLYNSHRYVDKIKDLDQIKTVKFDNIYFKNSMVESLLEYNNNIIVHNDDKRKSRFVYESYRRAETSTL